LCEASRRLDVPPSGDCARAAADHLVDGAAALRSHADVQRPACTVKIDAVELTVVRDPSGHLDHVFVSDDEIHCCAASLANKRTRALDLAGGVLVEFRRDARTDMASQRWRCESIGEL